MPLIHLFTLSALLNTLFIQHRFVEFPLYTKALPWIPFQGQESATSRWSTERHKAMNFFRETDKTFHTLWEEGAMLSWLLLMKQGLKQE